MVNSQLLRLSIASFVFSIPRRAWKTDEPKCNGEQRLSALPDVMFLQLFHGELKTNEFLS